ncbi:MAG: hypothetical protein NWP69_14520 [Congregibacter sp.]|nr:hypothetical protein [Congregibacter sp.]MDP5071972.1 hypothetical protein [Congregibacter sp.]
MTMLFRSTDLAWLLIVSALYTSAASAEVLRLHQPGGQLLDFAALSAIVQEETGISLKQSSSNAEDDDPIDALLGGSAELAIIENTRAFQAGVRSILPIYQSVVHLAVPQALDLGEFRRQGRLPKLQILNSSHTARVVLDLLFERASELPETYELWSAGDVGAPDMLVYVGPINPHNISWFPDGFTLVALSQFDAAGAEFYIDGIRYLVPQLRATRIPALTYSLPGNQVGIDALAVDMLLVTNKTTSDSTIYRLTRVLLEQKPRFAAVEPALFRWMNEDFSPADFMFPLHNGARQYFERDQPGFLERYADSLNFLVYLLVLLVTGALAFGRWRARRRKDRIDDFYLRILNLRRTTAFDDPQRCLGELQQIEDEAFAGLIAERLAADDSFRIFTELAAGLRTELKGQINSGSATQAEQ